MKHYFCFVLLVALMACTPKGEKEREEQGNDSILWAMQGVWLDDNTEQPLFKIKKDSIYYASQINVPMHLSVTQDTLTVYGVDTVLYPIVKRGAHILQFYTPIGDLVSLHKAESDTLSFGMTVNVTQPREVIKKDSVVMYQNKRYRGYVYINPSTKKIVRPGVTEEGLSIDNVYYDNIIHICVYQGAQKLYAQDITKQMFAGRIPADFLGASILSDMEFTGVDAGGCHYLATLCIPDGACFYIGLTIKDGAMTYQIRQ